MSGSMSFLAGLVVGIALAVAGPAAAENMLRLRRRDLHQFRHRGAIAMISPKAQAVLVLLCMITCAKNALALDCGSVPPVENEKLKGAIEGKATFSLHS